MLAVFRDESPVHHIVRNRIDNLLIRLVYFQRASKLGRLARPVLYLMGIDIPSKVQIGKRLVLTHVTAGVVIHENTIIGDDVLIHQNVTVGRGDGWNRPTNGPARAVIGNKAILATGAVVLTKDGQTLRVGEGTIVAANAVLTQSTGDWEVWGGIPARKISDRPSPVGDAARAALREAAAGFLAEPPLRTVELSDGVRGWQVGATSSGDLLALSVDGRPLIYRPARSRIFGQGEWVEVTDADQIEAILTTAADVKWLGGYLA